MQSTIELQPPTTASVAELARLVNCMDENELATLAGVKNSTLDSWRKRGKGPDYVLLGCNYLYPIHSVQNYLLNLIRVRTTIEPDSMLI